MKPEDLFDRIGDAEEHYLSDARVKKKKRRVWISAASVAAVLVTVILLSAVLQPWNGLFGKETAGVYVPKPVVPNLNYDPTLLGSFTLSAAKYPQMVQIPADESDYEASEAWIDGRLAQKEAFHALKSLPNDFFSASLKAFLADTDGDNAVCSPVNIYMALAMLAEITEGESRAEILSTLGADSIESLRTTASAIWNAHYCDDGTVTSILASSVWMRDDIAYTEETVRRLSETYYASSYQGKMGSDAYNEALRTWMNIQTGGMLSDQLSDLEMDADTILALATTVYFRAKWASTFDSAKNSERVFHGNEGDISAVFMNTVQWGNYYWGEHFSSVGLPFDQGGSMYLILPDEGDSVESLLSDNEVLSLIESRADFKHKKYCEITLSVPKFDVSSKLDLEDGLKELGIESVFDVAKADFSAITSEPDVMLSEASHGARVTIDEEGCVAAAYTVLMMDGTSESIGEKIEFTVDRPFLFVITSEVGLPLFVGVVNSLE